MKQSNSLTLTLAALLCSCLLWNLEAQTIDSKKFYRLTTQWQGDGKSLDVINDGKNNNQLQLATTGNFTGQQWKFTAVNGGFYRMTTAFQGDGKSLDVVNDGKNNNQLQLAKTGNFSGQYWKLTDLKNGYFRLTTQWQGDGKALDVVNDGKNNNKLQLAKTGNFTGQYWKLTELTYVGKASVHNLNKPGVSVFKTMTVTSKDVIEAGQYTPTQTQFPSMPAGGTYNIFILTQKENASAQAFINWSTDDKNLEKKIKNFGRTPITLESGSSHTMEVGDELRLFAEGQKLVFYVYRAGKLVSHFSCAMPK